LGRGGVDQGDFGATPARQGDGAALRQPEQPEGGVFVFGGTAGKGGQKNVHTLGGIMRDSQATGRMCGDENLEVHRGDYLQPQGMIGNDAKFWGPSPGTGPNILNFGCLREGSGSETSIGSYSTWRAVSGPLQPWAGFPPLWSKRFFLPAPT